MNPARFAWNVCKKIDHATKPLENLETWRKIGLGMGVVAVAAATAERTHNVILDRLDERRDQIESIDQPSQSQLPTPEQQ